MTNPNHPMSAHGKAATQQRNSAKAKADKGAALSSEIEGILRDAAKRVAHLVKQEKKSERQVDPHIFLGIKP